MNGAKRVQMTRQKPWRVHYPDAVNVARPTKWGNPFPTDGDWITWTAVSLGYHGNAAGRRAAAVAMHRSWLLGEPVRLGVFADSLTGGVIEFANGEKRTVRDHVAAIAAGAASLYEGPKAVDRPTDLAPLRGKDLACWCPLDQPCHADVLLELANAPEAGDQR